MNIGSIGGAGDSGFNYVKSEPLEKASARPHGGGGPQAVESSKNVSTMSDAELEAAAAEGSLEAQQELAKRRAAEGAKGAAGAASGEADAAPALLDILA